MRGADRPARLIIIARRDFMGMYGDGRGGGDRDSGGYDSGGYRGRGDYRGSGGYRGSGDYRGRPAHGPHDDDRGFLDRAGDEVRSWFGDEDAQHRREADERRWAREQGRTGRRDNYGRLDHERGETPGGGWGNQSGESWHRDRPGRSGWGGERPEREAPAGLGYFADGEARSGGQQDPHYSEWRRRQIEDLDRDYDEYRREHQSRFEREFASWRAQRQGQRQALGRVAEHMEVVGSDGAHVGRVDKVRGDRIVLARSDEAADGIHHSLPCAWVGNVADKVTLNKSAEEAKQAWRDEEGGRALFERDAAGEEARGPRNLDRSFSGTHRDRE
jgi:hypothetical protein